MIEIWKDIKGYEGLYQVSNLGRIKSNKLFETGIINGSATKKGYTAIALYGNDRIRTIFQAHRIVAKMFIDNPDNKPQVNHINGIKTDNRVVNLEWCTGSENVRHAFKIGTRRPFYGVENANSKLNNEKVLAIRSTYADGGVTMRSLAQKYHVDFALVQRIIRRKCWIHLN